VNRRNWIVGLTFAVTMLAGISAGAQEPATPDASGGQPPQQGQGYGRGQNGPRPLMGKITSINAGTMVITKQDGSTVTVKVTDQTEFRKDREKASGADFKVGDTVMVRGDENADHTVTAKIIGTRGGGPGGPGGERGGQPLGTLGKDYIAGEIKGIDAPKVTVLRTDNVTQTLELNEQTSLRRGRESITMADIKVGDHLMARGEVQNGSFVPTGVMVMNPEQWQRMQDRMAQGAAGKPAGTEAAPPKSQE
jgi:Domain of unknown function (DUF5666)